MEFFSGSAADMLKKYGQAVPEQQPMSSLEEAQAAKAKLEAEKEPEAHFHDGHACTADHSSEHSHDKASAHAHEHDGHACTEDHDHAPHAHEHGHKKSACSEDHSHDGGHARRRRPRGGARRRKEFFESADRQVRGITKEGQARPRPRVLPRPRRPRALPFA